VVACLQLFLVDVGVVDAVDVQRPQVAAPVETMASIIPYFTMSR
jgi:hypothetical protein